MPKFTFKAIDSKGKEKSGKIDAASSQEAHAKLSAQGLIPTSVTGAADSPAAAAAGPVTANLKLAQKARISSEQRAVFTRQLATLIQAGLPLLRALEVILRQQKKPGFRDVVAYLVENVKTGNTFSDGIAQFPKIFDHLYLNMVRAGEASGQLDTVLSRLALFQEKAERIKKKVQSAMIYPAVVMTVAIAIVALLMILVVPQFQRIFATMVKGSLPDATKLLIAISDYFKNYWWSAPVIFAVVYFGYKAIRASAKGGRFLDRLTLRTPVIGALSSKVAISRFTRTFGTLISSGVPMLEALSIVRDVVGNLHVGDALAKVHDRVRDGENLSAPLAQAKVFPDIVSAMIEVGEETGELSPMCTRIADNYDEEVDNAVNAMTKTIEPIMIVFLAIVVGFIVIALFLPMIGIMGSFK